MKVLVISHMYPSSSSSIYGIFVHQQAIELQRQGCDVKVIAPTPWSPFPVKYFTKKWKVYSEVPDRSILDEIEIYHPRYLAFPRHLLYSTSGTRMYLGARKIVSNIYEDFKFDIINAHTALPCGFAAMMLNRIYSKPFIVTIHGADLQKTIHRNDGCRRAIVKVFEHADRVVTVSNKLDKIARRYIGSHNKLEVVNDGIDAKEVIAGQSVVASKYTDRRILLSVSSLIKSKGIDLNIMALSKLVGKYPTLKYLVIGAGVELPHLRRLTLALGIEHHVEFIGELPHHKVMEYMSIADIFSLPSWQEGFGIVYLEAALHGKPVIACEGEGISDVLENDKTGLFVKPRDVDSLVRAMDFLLANPDKSREIGESARKLVLEQYTWEKNARKYIEIYKKLLATRR